MTSLKHFSDRGQSTSSTLDEHGGIISQLRADNPRIIILVAAIIPMRNQDTAAFNTELAAWLPTQANASSPISLVDHDSGFDPQNDLFDNWHPNTNGEEKIATAWFNALDPILGDFNTAPTVTLNGPASVQLPLASIDLDALLTDDGLPDGSLSYAWSQTSGPGTAVFSNPTGSGTDADTTVTLDIPGDYTLKLSVDDGALSTAATITVTLLEENTPPSGDSPVLSGIAGFWQLDENSGTRAADSSGQGNHGLLRALDNAHWQPGVHHSALCFDGLPQQQIEIASPSTALEPTSLTIAGWVRVDAALGDWAWNAVSLSNAGLRDGQWHHLAGSYDATSQLLSIYRDGTFLNSTHADQPIQYQIGDSVSIGSMLGERNFFGCLDEIQIYGRALTGQEIQIRATR